MNQPSTNNPKESKVQRAGRWVDSQFTTRWEKNLNAKLALAPTKKVSPEIATANSRWIKLFTRLAPTMIIVGLIFPESSTATLGWFGRLLDFVSNAVPSINKLANASPMPSLVRGYLGFLTLIIIGSALFLILKEPFNARQKYIATTKQSISTYLKVYISGVLFLPFILWFFWALPVTVRLGFDTGRGQMILHIMLTSRLGLTIIGSFAAMCIAFTLFLFLLLIITSIYRVSNLNKGVENGK